MKYLLTLFILLTSTILYSQGMRWRAYRLAFYSEATQKWEKAGDTDVLVVASEGASRITVYTEDVQYYDCISEFDVYTDEDGDRTILANYINESGVEVTLKLIKIESMGEIPFFQLYIFRPDFWYVYSMSRID